jgi:hypothetical protein
VSVLWADATQPPQIEHFKDAFEAVGAEGMFS